jgi:hypothetical protein
MPKLQIYFNPENSAFDLYEVYFEKVKESIVSTRTTFTNTLNQEIYFTGPVPFGKFNRRHFNFQTVGLTATGALEMNMVVVMTGFAAGIVAQGILETPLVIQHFMNKSFVQKSLERTINRYTIKLVIDFLFNVAMRKRIVFVQEKMKNLLSAGSGAQPECFQ